MTNQDLLWLDANAGFSFRELAANERELADKLAPVLADSRARRIIDPRTGGRRPLAMNNLLPEVDDFLKELPRSAAPLTGSYRPIHETPRS